MVVLQAFISAAIAVDLAINAVAVPWLIKLQREERSSRTFQGVCTLALAAELGTAFVLTARTPAPILVIATLGALAIYKFALIVLAP
jgi:hypothetical protein